MDRQQMKALFLRMMAGDQVAAQELADYWRGQGLQAIDGNAPGNKDLENLVYDFAYEIVEKRMRRDFHFLLDRHSVASVLHPAWLRVIGPSPLPIEDIASLCRRIAAMVHFAFLDIVKAQRLWDKRHHDPRGRGGEAVDEPDYALGQVDDGGSLDPARLAIWTEFHEKIASLPNDEREVFCLDYYMGMSRRQIAEQLGMTEHRVRVLLLKAHERLGGNLPGTP